MPDIQLSHDQLEAVGPRNPKPPSDDDRDLLRLAHKRFRLCEEAEASIRAQAMDDLKFRIGEQWPDDIKTSRTNDGRPCLTMNRLNYINKSSFL